MTFDADKRVEEYLAQSFKGKVPDQYLRGRALLDVHEKLLGRLAQQVGQEVSSQELERVAGQRETPRRIRELRVEFGYQIEARRRGREYAYALVDTNPDVARAAWWRLRNNIRRDSIAAREKVLLVLKARVGEVISGEDLQYVGNIQEVKRRARELRGEHGWRISTGLNRADLRPDEYVLESLEQRPETDRVDAKTFDAVLKRDNYTCKNCGWRKGDPETKGRRFLEVHHKTQVVHGGRPQMENLVTLCNVCHDAIPVDRTPM